MCFLKVYLLKPWPWNVMVFGDGALGRWLERWLMRSWEWGPQDGISAFIRGDTGELAVSLHKCTRKGHVRTAGRWPSASWEESPQQNPALPTAWSQTSSLWSCVVEATWSRGFCYGSLHRPLHVFLFISTSLHCRDLLQFACPFSCSWPFGLFPVWGYHE